MDAGGELKTTAYTDKDRHQALLRYRNDSAIEKEEGMEDRNS